MNTRTFMHHHNNHSTERNAGLEKTDSRMTLTMQKVSTQLYHRRLIHTSPNSLQTALLKAYRTHPILI